jgi:hypothetical protein
MQLLVFRAGARRVPLTHAIEAGGAAHLCTFYDRPRGSREGRYSRASCGGCERALLSQR